eukprot:GHVU01067668.1.p1 GENE.GHVU01067668.1~~GHVU01067668.1.p1  ORF type:complete len:132 (-),score=15.55 GHVU01067668.1:356-751(-)
MDSLDSMRAQHSQESQGFEIPVNENVDQNAYQERVVASGDEPAEWELKWLLKLTRKVVQLSRKRGDDGEMNEVRTPGYECNTCGAFLTTFGKSTSNPAKHFRRPTLPNCTQAYTEVMKQLGQETTARAISY